MSRGPEIVSIRQYTHDSLHRQGMRIWPLMARELAASRYLTWVLARRNLSARYRQSILSYLWIILPPLAAVALFSYLSGNRVIDVGATDLPYLSYALLNLSIWLLFANVLLSATKSLLEAGNLVTRVNFPKAALVMASAGDPIIEFVIRFLAVLVVFNLQGVDIGWYLVPALLLVVPVLMMAVGLGFLFSILNLVIRDTANVLTIALTIGIFLTPVLYPPAMLLQFPWLYLLNPLNPVLENFHSLVLNGELTNELMLFASSIASITVFLAGLRIFNLTLPRISERV